MKARKLLPTPEFKRDPADCVSGKNCLAGLRPWRAQTYRLELGGIGEKLICHNYGHGGAGITLSWGCAVEVHRLLAGVGIDSSRHKIAVIGAGVIGLTSAAVLREHDFDVTIYAETFPPHTTSNIAGGQWSPSVIQYLDKEKFVDILTKSHGKFSSQLGDKFGVYKKENYKTTIGAFKDVPDTLVPRVELDSLPFEAHENVSGYRFDTLLIETPKFLNQLIELLKKDGVKFFHRRFYTEDCLKELKEHAVVNCTGSGSREIFCDQNVIPLKGNIVLLPAQNKLNYLYSAGARYVFPRKDFVIVGGSFDDCYPSDTPECNVCDKILTDVKGLFDKKKPSPKKTDELLSYEVLGQKYYDL